MIVLLVSSKELMMEFDGIFRCFSLVKAVHIELNGIVFTCLTYEDILECLK